MYIYNIQTCIYIYIYIYILYIRTGKSTGPAELALALAQRSLYTDHRCILIVDGLKEANHEDMLMSGMCIGLRVYVCIQTIDVF